MTAQLRIGLTADVENDVAPAATNTNAAQECNCASADWLGSRQVQETTLRQSPSQIH